MKYTIVVDIIHLYYTVVFNIVGFKVKVVFVIGVFFVVFSYCIEIDSYNCKFFIFFSNAKCIYIFILKFSNLFISEFFFNSMFDMFKRIDTKILPKSMGNNIRFVIIILHSIFIILTFF